MGLQSKAKDYIQNKLGSVVEGLTEDLKIKSFHGFKLEIGDCEIKPPSIRLRSDGFKLKIIDKSTGKAISDIPMPVDIRIKIPAVKIINKKVLDIKPEIDIMLKPRK